MQVATKSNFVLVQNPLLVRNGLLMVSILMSLIIGGTKNSKITTHWHDQFHKNTAKVNKQGGRCLLQILHIYCITECFLWCVQCCTSVLHTK